MLLLIDGQEGELRYTKARITHYIHTAYCTGVTGR